MKLVKKVIVLLIVALFSVALFANIAGAEEKVIIKRRDMFEIIEEEWELSNVQQSAPWFGAGMDDKYPFYEIIEIDGIPWQDSIYADAITDNLEYYGNGRLSSNPELIEIVTDKRFNGLGDKVWKLFEEGKSVPEIKQILVGDTEETLEPVEEQPSIEPGDNVLPALPSPVLEKITVVLYIDKKDYSVSRNDDWHGGHLDAAPTIENGRTLVPLRGILEEFGADIEWLPRSRQVKAKYKGKEVTLAIDSTDALVDGRSVKLDVPAKIVNDRTLIPLRFVSEQIGMNVEWNEEARSVKITE